MRLSSQFLSPLGHMYCFYSPPNPSRLTSVSTLPVCQASSHATEANKWERWILECRAPATMRHLPNTSYTCATLCLCIWSSHHQTVLSSSSPGKLLFILQDEKVKMSPPLWGFAHWGVCQHFPFLPRYCILPPCKLQNLPCLSYIRAFAHSSLCLECSSPDVST